MVIGTGGLKEVGWRLSVADSKIMGTVTRRLGVVGLRLPLAEGMIMGTVTIRLGGGWVEAVYREVSELGLSMRGCEVVWILYLADLFIRVFQYNRFQKNILRNFFPKGFW